MLCIAGITKQLSILFWVKLYCFESYDVEKAYLNGVSFYGLLASYICECGRNVVIE